MRGGVPALCWNHALAQRNLWRTRGTQSRLKVGFVLAFGLALELFLWWLFYDAFRFLDSFGGMGAMIVRRLFSLFFLGLGLMLILSSIVAGFAALFRGNDVPFLTACPLEERQIVGYKFLEASMAASWAFFVFILPFIGAYAMYVRASPLFLLSAVVFAAPFMYVCCGLGTLVLLPVVRWAPRGRAVRWALAGGAAAPAVWAALVSTKARAVLDSDRFNMAQWVPGLELSNHALLPSWWAVEGMLSLSRGQWGRGLLLWALLATTALVLYFAVEWVGVRVFHEAWLRTVQGSGRGDRRALSFGGADRVLRVLPADVRAMVMKDVRTFFRDPVQWSQAAVFFGLLGLYFLNLRTLNYHNLPGHWPNAIAFLNLFSVSAVICSLGSRFVYPQLSLEGQAFWIVGLSPATMRRVVLAKWAVAGLVLLAVNVLLATLSSRMLGIPATTQWIAAALVTCVALAVSGLSTGLGALFMDLRQSNPAAIVSGFGGTLNLVISLAYMLSAILPFAALCHYRVIGALQAAEFRTWLGLAAAWLALITAVTIAVPLALGMRSLRRREY